MIFINELFFSNYISHVPKLENFNKFLKPRTELQLSPKLLLKILKNVIDFKDMMIFFFRHIPKKIYLIINLFIYLLNNIYLI